jgi:hypothetical protein
MKKFVAYTHKGKPVIYEVEAELVSALQDPSIKWLPSSEYTIAVSAPSSFAEKNAKGELIYPIFYSHSLFETEEQAVAWHKMSLEKTMKERAERHGETSSEEELKTKIAEITVFHLTE